MKSQRPATTPGEHAKLDQCVTKLHGPGGLLSQKQSRTSSSLTRGSLVPERSRLQLDARGITTTMYTIRRIMKVLGLRRQVSPSTEGRSLREDLCVRILMRKSIVTSSVLVVSRLCRLLSLCGYITYLRTAQGWMYLVTAIDSSTRMVVGWQVADHMKT